ncbi:MAG TPA: DUF533 domain-containing protein [Verrucomicrobiae bacterium]|jgi:uncharacterized protein (DUF697 family)/tellurite resistance protein|nr:DUF533 domain-containing protein [Verrucomicrobiae bacterium]
MTTIQPNLNELEHRAVIGAAVLAAFADGGQDESERAQIQRIVEGFPQDRPDLTCIYRDALSGKLTVAGLAAQLRTAESRALAYQMATCICYADGTLQDGEKRYLSDLWHALQLDGTAGTHQQTAEALAAGACQGAPPVIDSGRDAELDKLILNAAILNGGLEIIPHTLATMAIVPLQMRMVYKIGHSYGYELDSGHVKDFLATVGVGLTSQVFEGYAERVVGRLTGGLLGRFLGGLAGQATGSAFAFATTYALGQVARKYYASGRTLTAAQLKDVFSSMLAEGRNMQGRYSNDINQRSRQVNMSDLLPLVRS